MYALSELAFLGAKKAERIDKSAAADLYGTAVLHAYRYLFDERFAATRNPYDPQYRGAAICTTAPWSRCCGSSAAGRS